MPCDASSRVSCTKLEPEARYQFLLVCCKVKWQAMAGKSTATLHDPAWRSHRISAERWVVRLIRQLHAGGVVLHIFLPHLSLAYQTCESRGTSQTHTSIFCMALFSLENWARQIEPRMSDFICYKTRQAFVDGLGLYDI